MDQPDVNYDQLHNYRWLELDNPRRRLIFSFSVCFERKRSF